MRVRVTALEKPLSGNCSCLIKDKKALSREQALFHTVTIDRLLRIGLRRQCAGV